MSTQHTWGRTAEIRPAQPDEVAEAASVTTRAFRDSPMAVACWGASPAQRERGLQTVFGRFLPTMSQPPWLALHGGRIAGVLGMAPAGTCLQTPLGPTVRVLTAMLIRSPLAAKRFRDWMLVYERHDPVETHVHLGPVAVEPALQHGGIGSALLEHFCTSMDDEGVATYLETDAAANLGLYERFGFQVIGQERILGVDNWFMWRARI